MTTLLYLVLWVVCGLLRVRLLRPHMDADDAVMRLGYIAGPLLLGLALVVWLDAGLQAVVKWMLSGRAGR